MPTHCLSAAYTAIRVVAANALYLFDKVAQQQTSFPRLRVYANQRMFGFIHLGRELFAITFEPRLISIAGRSIVIHIGMQGTQTVG